LNERRIYIIADNEHGTDVQMNDTQCSNAN